MNDFGKALRQIRNIGRETDPSPRIDILAFSIGEQLEFLKSRRREAAPSVTLPAGEVQTTPFGSHYAVHTIYPGDYFHGKVRLSRFLSAELKLLMGLMGEKGTVPERGRVIFLDTETTGVQGGTGICPFMVGLGYFDGDEFNVLQYFIRDFDEEPSMLAALAALLARFDLVITYNGMAFDVPLVETRFTLARMDNPFRAMSHYDFLFSARRLWRNGHGSCKLTSLEREMLSFLRGPDVPGSMIPRAYFDYLHRRSSPTLHSVFTHNVHDVVSLAALTIHACDRVALEPAPLDDPLDLYSLARVLENSAHWRQSIRLYQMAIDGGLPDDFRKKALENLSVMYRRASEHEHSRAVCEQLIGFAEFSMAGYEGAAIYYERFGGDLEKAVQILEEGLSRAANKRCQTLLKARWDRLQQRTLPR